MQNPRCQVFAQRRFALLLAVAALEQRLAGGVEVKRYPVCGEKSIHPHVRRGGVDARPFAACLAKLVADGVLDFQGDEIQAAQGALDRADLDAESLLDVEIASPGQGQRGAVDVFLAAVGLFCQPPQDAAGDPAPQVDAIAQRQVADKTDAAVGGGYVGCAEFFQLGGQRSFQATRAGGEKVLGFHG